MQVKYLTVKAARNLLLQGLQYLLIITIFLAALLLSLFQSCIIATHYYGPQLAQWVNSYLKQQQQQAIWPVQLTISSIRCTWYHLHPMIFLNQIQLRPTTQFDSIQSIQSVQNTQSMQNDHALSALPRLLAACQLQPGSSIGISLLDLLKIYQTSGLPQQLWGPLVLQRLHLTIDQDYVAELASRLGLRLDRSSVTQTDSPSATPPSPSLDATNNQTGLLQHKNLYNLHNLHIENSSIQIHRHAKPNVALIKLFIRKLKLANEQDADYHLRWHSWLSGQFVQGICSGNIALTHKTTSKKANPPTAHAPIRSKIKGSIYLSDYKLQVDESLTALVAWGLLPQSVLRAEDATTAAPTTIATLPDRIDLMVNILRGQIAWPSRLHKPLNLKNISGRMNWYGKQNMWQLSNLEIQDACCFFKGNLLLKPAGGLDSYLEAIASLACRDLRQLHHYYPKGMLDPEAEQWLRHAFLQGNVPHGRLYFKGQLSRFPFNTSLPATTLATIEGTPPSPTPTPAELFKIELTAKDLVLKYDPDWPVIEQLNGKVLFLGPKLYIEATSGTMLGVDLCRRTPTMLRDEQNQATFVEANHATAPHMNDGSNGINPRHNNDNDNTSNNNNKVIAVINDLAHPELIITGKVRTDFSQLLNFINHSPLKTSLGQRLVPLQIQSSSKLTLRLMLPLWQTPMRDISVNGSVSITNGHLSVPIAYPITIHQLKGKVHFNQEQILPSAISGQLGRACPIAITIGRSQQPEWIKIHSRFKLPLLQLAELGPSFRQLVTKWPLLFPSPTTVSSASSTSPLLSGQLPLDISILIPKNVDSKPIDSKLATDQNDKNDNSYQFVITSQLRGTRFNLPAPLTKTAAESTELSLVGNTTSNNLELIGKLGSLLQGTAKWQAKNGSWALSQAQLVLTDATPNNKPDHAIEGIKQSIANLQCNLHLKRLDLTPWITLYQQITSSALSAQDKTTVINQVWNADVRHLLLNGHDLGSVQGSYLHDQQRITVNSQSDLVRGTLLWPKSDHYNHRQPSQKPIEIKLAFLNLDKLLASRQANQITPTDNPWTLTFPRQLINLSIDQLRINGARFHQFQTQLDATSTPSSRQAQIKQLSFDWQQTATTGTGSITLAKTGGLEELKLKGKLSCPNVGEQLRQLALTDHLVQGNGWLSGELSYRPTPSTLTATSPNASFDWRNLTGQIQGQVDKGFIVNLDRLATANLTLGKIINALSVNSLLDRLTLNFKDITSKGLAFKNVLLAGQLHEGMLTVDKLALNSTTVDADATGWLNLIKRKYDLQVKITPYLTKSVPIAATLLGGPIAGMVGLVADSVATVAGRKIINYSYHLEGNW